MILPIDATAQSSEPWPSFHKRFRPRVSIRVLFVGVTIVSIGLGLLADRYRRRERAMALLTQREIVVNAKPPVTLLGSLLARVFSPKAVSCVDRIEIRQQVLDGELRWALRQFSEVREVAIIHARITDSDCRILAELPNLERVSFHGSHFNNNALSKLFPNCRLVVISLSFTNAGDDDCAELACCPLLARLSLAGTNISDKGMQSLALLPNLTHLSVSPDRITEVGIESVLRHRPRLVLQCFGPGGPSDRTWASIKERFPLSTIHR